MLTLAQIIVTTNDKEILHNISCDFMPGKIYAIMGMNGSGKSTLAKTIMGDPSCTISSGKIFLDNQDITLVPPNLRAQSGIFLAPQSPLAIPGITVQQLLRAAIPRDKCTSEALITKIQHAAKDLMIKKELLTRSLNENFSGGERKKMEMLQASVLDPQFLILDEIDTGVDVDALTTIATHIVQMIKSDPKKTFIIITHYNRILAQLPVDEVLVMHDGHIIQRGDASLAHKIETKGYKK